jgi:hypothetical protein
MSVIVMNNTYFKSSSIQTTLGFIPILVDFSKMKGANILIACSNGSHLLVNVTPPNRTCSVYLSDKDEIVHTDVVQIFKAAQSSLSWSEI